tara:strand:- start:237 stop:461 length:225 start_codon:yes stop_codon:yes gene_type:complete
MGVFEKVEAELANGLSIDEALKKVKCSRSGYESGKRRAKKNVKVVVKELKAPSLADYIDAIEKNMVQVKRILGL